MIKQLTLDNSGIAPDIVFLDSTRLRAAYGTMDNTVRVVDLDLDLNIIAERKIPLGFSHSFPRLSKDGWIGYKSNDSNYTTRLLHLESGNMITLGRGEGNESVCFGDGIFAYQGENFDIHRIILSTLVELDVIPEAGAPDGIGVLNPEPVLVKDMHKIYPDLGRDVARFDFSGSFVAGELGIALGTLVKYRDTQTLLWPGEVTNWPKCDSYGNWVAVAVWGDQGIRITLLDTIYIQQTPWVDPRPPMPPPEIEFTLNSHEAIAPAKIIGTLTKKVNVATHRWRLGPAGSPNLSKNLPIDDDVHTFDIPKGGNYEIEVAAQGPPVDADHRPYEYDDVIVTPRQSIMILGKTDPSFYYGIITAFKNPIGRSKYADLARYGWNLARMDVMTLGKDSIAEMVGEARDEGFQPMTISTVSQIPLTPDNTFINIYGITPDPTTKGTEPDSMGFDPVKIALAINEQMPYARAHNQRIFAGLISNPGIKSLQWLKRMTDVLEPDVDVSYNRYPQRDEDVATIPRNDFKTLEAEFFAVRAAAGVGRKIFCTEFSWRNDPFKQKRYFWGIPYSSFTRTLSQKETHDRIRDWFHLLRAHGFLGGALFQIWEGDVGCTGVYTHDWIPKLAINIPNES